jgi:uncharacterized repeat protein (TIGR03803 family)
VFKIAPGGAETVLHNFCESRNCSDGQLPHGGLIMDKAGNLYGTSTYGGDAKGQGVAFRLAPDGTVTILHSFCQEQDCKDGAWPEPGTILDKAGNLSGATSLDGRSGDGTIFRLKK